MSTAAAVVACALVLLGRSERALPRIVLLDAAPQHASAQAEAFVSLPDPNIYLVTSSSVFRAAMESRTSCGSSVPVKKLASIIAHEEWHVRHGPEERGAYEKQLSTLLQLGVAPDTSLYVSVVRAMRAVLKKRNQKPEMVLAEGLERAHETAIDPVLPSPHP